MKEIKKNFFWKIKKKILKHDDFGLFFSLNFLFVFSFNFSDTTE